MDTAPAWHKAGFDLFTSTRVACSELFQQELHSPSPANDVTTLYLTLLMNAATISDTIAFLCVNKRVKEALILSRTVIESCVNAAYILTIGEAAAIQAQEHAEQRRLRNVRRTYRLHKTIIKILGPYKIASPLRPEIKKAKQKFTNSRGDEIEAWTNLSLQARIDSITEKHGFQNTKGIWMAHRFLYSDASQVAHASLYGCLFIWGFYGPGPIDHLSIAHSPEELAVQMNVIMGLCLLSTIRCFPSSTDQSVVAKAESALKTFISEFEAHAKRPRASEAEN